MISVTVLTWISLVVVDILPLLIICGLAFGLLTSLWMTFGGRSAFRSLYKQPLSEDEITYLLESNPAATPLERDYLALARDAVRQRAPVDAATTVHTQQAVLLLGEAIDALPDVPTLPLDAAALHAEARTIEAQIAEQTDPVIAGSMERRAEAIRRRASAGERAALTVRRAEALTAEIEAQIAALREGIVALATGSQSADPATARHLTDLSESAQQVAAEAKSVSDARAELAGESLLLRARMF